MKETVVHVNAEVNDSSKSISRLQMPHVFLVANIWCADELQKRAWPQRTNTILDLGLAQQMLLVI